MLVEPEEGTCVIDNLLKEIRSGTTLRKTNRKSIHHGPKLSPQEMEKLKRIASQVRTGLIISPARLITLMLDHLPYP